METPLPVGEKSVGGRAFALASQAWGAAAAEAARTRREETAAANFIVRFC